MELKLSIELLSMELMMWIYFGWYTNGSCWVHFSSPQDLWVQFSDPWVMLGPSTKIGIPPQQDLIKPEPT
jgi:hypothetical protein